MTLLFLYIPESIRVSQVCSILGLKDNRAAIKWLNANGVPISTVGNHNVVDRFLFEFKRQQLFVEQLRNSYPNNWFDIYEENTPDKGMVKSIRELYPELTVVNKTRNKHITKFIK